MYIFHIYNQKITYANIHTSVHTCKSHVYTFQSPKKVATNFFKKFFNTRVWCLRRCGALSLSLSLSLHLSLFFYLPFVLDFFSRFLSPSISLSLSSLSLFSLALSLSLYLFFLSLSLSRSIYLSIYLSTYLSIHLFFSLRLSLFFSAKFTLRILLTEFVFILHKNKHGVIAIEISTWDPLVKSFTLGSLWGGINHLETVTYKNSD